MIEAPQPHALLIIVSGPAGSGKTTLCDRMLSTYQDRVNRVITATTRVPREGEHDGDHYHFLTHEAFDEQIDQDAFHEYALVYGNYYGTLKSEIYKGFERGDSDLLLNIDVQGAATFREKAKQDPLLQGHLITIFIMPPSLDELDKRLNNRGKDKQEEIEKRLKIAQNEIRSWQDYDYCIHSKDKETDFQILQSIYLAEKAKIR